MKKLFVSFLLLGCAGNARQAEVIELKPLMPVPAAVPVMQGNTNKDLLVYVLRLENALRLCNAGLAE